MPNRSVSYINAIHVQSIFTRFYAGFPQAMPEKPLTMRVPATSLFAGCHNGR